MSELTTATYEADNLITSTKKAIITDVLQLEAGQSVVRGEVLKAGATGLVAVTAGTDTPFAIALQTIDATAAAADIQYMVEGSVLESELTYAVGTIADFRVSFNENTRIYVEEV